MIQAKSKTEPHTEPAIIGVLAFLLMDNEWGLRADGFKWKPYPPKEAASEELTASSSRVVEITADDALQ